MGYNTVVMLVNDGMDQLEKNPKDFTQKLVQTACQRRNEVVDFGVGNHCNNVTVVKSQHMDVPQLVLVHENWCHPFNINYIEEMKDRGQLALLEARLDIAQIQLDYFKIELKKAMEEK